LTFNSTLIFSVLLILWVRFVFVVIRHACVPNWS